MANRNFNQPPNIDPSNLAENEIIIFKYDKDGNLTSIRKVRRNIGCAFFYAVIMLGLLGYGVSYFFGAV